MKKIALAALFVAAFFKTQAQVELKTNPISLLFGAGQVCFEGLLSEDWGVEGDLLVTQGGYGWFFGLGKYYLNPKYGADRFHVGAFVGGSFSEDTGGGGLGFMAGYKVVSAKNFVFDIGLGVGRNLVSNFNFEGLFYGKLAIGYRFPGKSGKNKQ